MRRLFLSLIALSSLSLALSAQTWEDALLFSENDYLGTARSIAIANATTAVGADPGSMIMNPAGSAVAGYSQYMITPGLSIVSNFAQGDVGYSNGVNSSIVRPKLPNIGAIWNMDTGRRKGFKRHSFGFVMNASADYTDKLLASGINANNSYAASLATSAEGFARNVFDSQDWNYYGSPSLMPAWIDMVGYSSGMFSGVSGNDGSYIAITEAITPEGYSIAGRLDQQYGKQSGGGKYDWVLNYAFNYSDMLYVGVSMGMQNIEYNVTEFWSESPADPSTFPDIIYDSGLALKFKGLEMKRKLDLSGSGIYGKLGVIVVPIKGVRLGAAIQTPTILDMRETYAYSGSVDYYNYSSSSVTSPEGENVYNFVSPARLNLGAAFTIGRSLLLSVDYESCNYSSCRFSEKDSDDISSGSYFDKPNANVKAMLGRAEEIRLGAEFKPIPAIALRAGFSHLSSAIKNSLEGDRNAFSAGLGYSSSGPLYADIAVRYRTFKTRTIVPYSYYYAPDASRFWEKEVDDSIATPIVSYNTGRTDVVFTLGWRF